MADYTDHKKVLDYLVTDQDADSDNREKVKEAHLFLNKRNGQWEQSWWDRCEGKPRYTFDMTTPIIKQIVGDLKKADFNIKITPSGGKATKDTARVLDGLIRNIENVSRAQQRVYIKSGKSLAIGGMDGWRIDQMHVDDDSFDQDLVINPIHNFVDRVWFDCSAEERDKSDATRCFVLQAMSKDEYENKWPKGSGESIQITTETSAYYHKPDLTVVGEIFYVRQVLREIVEMSDGKVYEVNGDYLAIKDELAAAGITEKRNRKRQKKVVMVRHFDNKGWLGEAKETVFSYIPVIPVYANYEIFENKTIYYGEVEKLIDPQRVLNYSQSREIEEGALAPRKKYWMTLAQAAGHESSISQLNTSADPVQFYTPDQQAPGQPLQTGGAEINPGLRVITESMRQTIGQVSGMFAANMGDNPGLQSGIAIEKLQNKGSVGSMEYFSSMETGISHTARILVDAIPRVYDTERQQRILNEDGSFDMIMLNEVRIDEQTGEEITLNDLSIGTYDVICSAGKAFSNRQEEMVDSILSIGAVDPTIIGLGGDILLNSIDAPGMDKLAERKRAQLLISGVIPQSQMTDEEKQQIQAQGENKQPDAGTLLAQAEMEKAKAAQMKVEVDGMLRQTDQEIAMAKLEQSGQKDVITAQQLQQEFNLKLEKMQQDMLLAMDERELRRQVAVGTMQKTQAETLNVLKQATAPLPGEMPDAEDEMVDDAIDRQAMGIVGSVGDEEYDYNPMTGGMTPRGR